MVDLAQEFVVVMALPHSEKRQKKNHTVYNKCILLDVLVCSIAEYFYKLCHILMSP